MSNYRRFSPYRQHYRAGSRAFQYIGWIVVAVIIVLLVKNVFSGGTRSPRNTNGGEVTLASNASGGTTDAAQRAGDELSTKGCPRAIERADLDGKFAALTVNGSRSGGDPAKVLEALKAAKVPVTLFATGTWVGANTPVITAYRDAGFDVFNYGYDRTSFVGMETDVMDEQLRKTDEAVSAITGKTTKPYLRPPLGDYNTATLDETRSQGYCTILWTVDAKDYLTNATVDTATANVREGLMNGAIVVMQANSAIGPDLIGPMVEGIKAQGYTLVSLRDLLRGTTASSNVSNPAATTNVNVNATNVNSSNKNANANKNSNVNRSSNTNATKTNANASVNTNS